MFSAWYVLWQIKRLSKKNSIDKFLRDKAYKIASDPKYNGYPGGLASTIYKFFDKKYSGSGVADESNDHVADELHKQTIRKFKRRKVYSLLKDNIWGVDLADMHSLYKYAWINMPGLFL